MIFISYFGNKFLSSENGIDVFFNGGYQLNHYIVASAIFIFIKQICKSQEENFINKAISKVGSLTYTIYYVHIFVLEMLIKFTKADHIIELVSLSIPTMIISALIAFIISIVKQKIVLFSNKFLVKS